MKSLSNFLLKSLLTFSGLLILTAVSGQEISQIHREVELDTKQGERFFTFLLEEKGAITVHSTRKPVDTKYRELRLTHFSTELDTLWSDSLLIDFGQFMTFSDYDSKYWYLLLNDDNRYKFTLIRTDIESGVSNRYKLEDIGKIDLNQFHAANGKVFLGGSVKDFPTVLTFDTEEDERDVLTSISQLNGKLQQMYIDEEQNRVLVMMKGREGTRDQGTYVNGYTISGQNLFKYKLPYNKDYELITFRPHVISPDEILILGTYSLANDYQSQGVYVLKLTEGYEEFLRFYDFGYLKRFFRFLPEKRQRKIERKFQSKRKDGKKYQFRYNLLVHDLVETDKQLLFSGEIVDISSRNTLPSTTLMSPSNFTQNTFSNFDDFGNNDYTSYIPESYYPEKYLPDREVATELDFEQGFVCGFDKQGNLLWDNSYAFDDTENDEPILLLGTYATTDSVYFIEPKENEIRHKSSALTAYSDSTSVTNYLIPLSDKTSNRYYPGGVRHWYGANFLFTGLRHYKVVQEEDKENRKVYVLTKISLQTKK